MSTPFLLDERNRPFVQGAGARPAPIPGRDKIGCLYVALVPFVLAGMFLLAFTLANWSTWLRFRAEGVAATAVVTGRAIDDGGDDTAYYVEYRYVTPDGRSFDRRDSVSRARYSQVIVGQHLAIEYLGGDPGSARLADENHLGFPLLLTAFSLAWNGFVLFVISVMAGGLLRERRLRARGRLVAAEILSYRADLDSDRDLTVNIAYRLISPDGLPISGRYRDTRNDLKGRDAPTCPAPAAALYIDERTHMLL